MAEIEVERALELQRQGHAIIIYEVFDSEGKHLSTGIHHYLSCNACRKIKEEKTIRERINKEVAESKPRTISAAAGLPGQS